MRQKVEEKKNKEEVNKEKDRKRKREKYAEKVRVVTLNFHEMFNKPNAQYTVLDMSTGA